MCTTLQICVYVLLLQVKMNGQVYDLQEEKICDNHVISHRYLVAKEGVSFKWIAPKTTDSTCIEFRSVHVCVPTPAVPVGLCGRRRCMCGMRGYVCETTMCACMYVCACVCVCVCARERARARMYVYVCMYVSVYVIACVFAWDGV